MPLSPAQRQRYRRNIDVVGLGEAGQERLLGSQVLVIGAGGLGSAALPYLAAAGVGRIDIVDGDVVELSNMQRQVLHTDLGRNKAESAAERLRLLNPEVRVRPLTHFLDRARAEELFPDYDLVLDCTDTFGAKFMISDAAAAVGSALVWASAVGMQGQCSVFGVPDDAGTRLYLRDLIVTEPDARRLPVGDSTSASSGRWWARSARCRPPRRSSCWPASAPPSSAACSSWTPPVPAGRSCRCAAALPPPQPGGSLMLSVEEYLDRVLSLATVLPAEDCPIGTGFGRVLAADLTARLPVPRSTTRRWTASRCVRPTPSAVPGCGSWATSPRARTAHPAVGPRRGGPDHDRRTAASRGGRGRAGRGHRSGTGRRPAAGRGERPRDDPGRTSAAAARTSPLARRRCVAGSAGRPRPRRPPRRSATPRSRCIAARPSRSLATGSELVAAGGTLGFGQIPDSNSVLLAGLVEQFGGEVISAVAVADDADAFRRGSPRPPGRTWS